MHQVVASMVTLALSAGIAYDGIGRLEMDAIGFYPVLFDFLS